jgi:hypothetical protein
MVVIFILVATAVIATVGAVGTSTAETDAYVLAISEIAEIKKLQAPEGTEADAIDFYMLPVGASISLTAKAEGVKQQISYYDENNRRLGGFAMGPAGTTSTDNQALAKGATVSYTLTASDIEQVFFSLDVTVDDEMTSYYYAVEEAKPVPAEGSLRPIPPVIITATPITSTVYLDKQPVALQAYTINGFNYFKLRDIAFVLNGTEKQFEIIWDAVENRILMTTNAPYTPTGGEAQLPATVKAESALSTTSTILLNEEASAFTAFGIKGNNYFKLRDLAEALDFSVEWDATSGRILVDTTQGYTK